MEDNASPPLIMNEGSSSSSHTTSSKESSWTSYLVDFIISETKTIAHETLSSSSFVPSNATVGGKGSTVADKVSGQNLTKMRRFKESLTDLRLKKRMITRKSVEEGELEDTASSPINCSPKAFGFSSECSPLGKKGFCLAPVSILHMYKDK